MIYESSPRPAPTFSLAKPIGMKLQQSDHHFIRDPPAEGGLIAYLPHVRLNISLRTEGTASNDVVLSIGFQP